MPLAWVRSVRSALIGSAHRVLTASLGVVFLGCVVALTVAVAPVTFLALVPTTHAVTLHLYGLVREANACWERDGRLYFQTQGQTYSVPKAGTR